MDWRAFKLLNSSERAWLARAVRAGATDWLAEWMPGAMLGATSCFDAGERASTRLSGEPLRWISGGNRYVALSIGICSDVERVMAEHMLGAGAHGALVGDVLTAALEGLVRRMLGSGAAEQAVLSARPPGAECWRRGSGAAIVEIEVGDSVLAILAAPGWVVRHLASRPHSTPGAHAELIDPRHCVGQAGVHLEVWAGSASLELGVLQTLAAGDVIRLESRIDQALSITVQGRETGRRAYLGRIAGQRAVQLAPLR